MKPKLIIIVLAVLTGLSLLAAFVFLVLLSPVRGVESAEIWQERDLSGSDDVPNLIMKDGEDFRILVLADTQLGPVPGDSRRTRKMIEKLVESTDPDFITTVGDNTSSFMGRSLTRKLISWYERIGLPWSVTLGNHDGEGLADRVWFGNRYQEAENSLFRSGPVNVFGVGNYGVNIVNEAGEIVYGLIMMDSNTYRNYESGRDYDFIRHDQIQWYQWMVDSLTEDQATSVPTILFFHIPLPEFDDARAAWEEGELEAVGGMRERVFCPPVNSGFFDAIKAAGSTTHIFNGHDHVNNLSLEWDGIRMTYVLKTGPGSYSDKDLQGGTLVTINAGTQEVSLEHIYID